MGATYGASKGGTVDLDQPLFDQQGGVFWTVQGRHGVVAKLYHPKVLQTHGQVLYKKLKAMLQRVPPGVEGANATAVWPTETLGSNEGFAGYLAPVGSAVLAPPDNRAASGAAGSVAERFRWAASLARAVACIQQAGHVVVNLGPQNLLPTTDGNAMLWGTDTFKIIGLDGQAFLSQLPPSEYRPPNAHGPAFEAAQWMEYDDRFALAVHLFQRLLGVHPYAGHLPPSVPDPDSPLTLLRQNIFPHGLRGQPDLEAVQRGRFQTLPDALRQAFTRAFVHGGGDPQLRPSAMDWQKILAVELARVT